ncbi:MAG: RecX family transcriptional regulator [Alloprevotella sp.]|nr:RecX family transcriptional regulator [Alloprevotella sp.]
MNKPTVEKLRSWAVSQCARRECCPSQLVSKLIEKGLPPAGARRLVEELKVEGLVDENRYVRAFVHDKTALERWGRVKTRQALLLRGLPADAVEDAIADISEELYLHNLTDLLAAKRRSLPADTPDRAMRDKLLRFAVARGYEPHLVIPLLG